MSIRYKIAFLFSVLVTLILALVSIAVYFFTVQERQDLFDSRLKKRALYTAGIFADKSDSAFSVLRRLDATGVSAFYDKSVSITAYNDAYAYMYADSTGDSIFLNKQVLERTKINGQYFFDYKNKKAVAVHHTDNNSNFIVAFAAYDRDGKEYLFELKRILLIALLLAVVLSFLAGIVFAKRLIAPIKRITGEVNLITSKNLSQRIKLDKEKDELTTLAETFNNLLDRLQDSFAIQRRFISNASHELSTPLTSVSSQLEVAMQKSRTLEEYQEVIASVYDDIRELQLLTQTLLDIAKAGSHGSIDLAEVRVDEILFKVVSDIQKQNKEYRAVLNFPVYSDEEKLLTVFGNTNLLYSALKNLIENGCKYARDNTTEVFAAFNANEIVIQVINHGDIIAAADLQNIFQPFFRTDSAQGKPGFGLGLTLTKGILSLHKGTIHVESGAQKGTVFTVSLPNIASAN
ncbi:HAMP domain-containing sensor histidine kinase [Ferruginibacter profundus]